ncbi:MAG: M42 family metallopeptidase [candidate division Zixibacteria bacterium]|nr:M42 family metallopeptidase [candidate division Zixibacteria bacterium]
MVEHLEAADEITYDKLGSIIARKNGAADTPKIMIAGHLDEIGFLVKEVTDDGYIKFFPLGGWWGHVALAQRVIIKTAKKDILGVIGSKPPHSLKAEERKKVLDIDDMYIDVGVNKKTDIKKLGIRPGDPIVPDAQFTTMNDPKMLLNKAFDNRIGVAAAVEVINKLKGKKHPNTVYGVGTVQEEVGLRGANTAAWAVDPDIAFVADVSLATDGPGASKSQTAKLGSGPSITVMDGSMIPHRKLRDFVIDTAEAAGIPYHLAALARGGTDGGRIHISRAGVPCIYMGVATRYIHSHTSIIHQDDFTNLVKLLIAVIKKLDSKTVKRLTKR